MDRSRFEIIYLPCPPEQVAAWREAMGIIYGLVCAARLSERSDLPMTLTPYQKSVEAVVLNAPGELTLDEIAQELFLLGWHGEALSEEKIRKALSELAITRIKEA
jgi:hypothetical protein